MGQEEAEPGSTIADVTTGGKFTPAETVLWPTDSEHMNLCAMTMPWQTILQTLCIKLTSTTQEAIDSVDGLTHVSLVQYLIRPVRSSVGADQSLMMKILILR